MEEDQHLNSFSKKIEKNEGNKIHIKVPRTEKQKFLDEIDPSAAQPYK